MSKKIVTTNIRLNLEHEADRRAWEHLQQMDKKRYKSYSRAVVMALNDFFDRQERLADDPYLETRAKEDAFLRRILDAIAQGLQESALLGTIKEIMQLSQGTSSLASAPLPEAAAENEEADSAALDFVNNF